MSEAQPSSELIVGIDLGTTHSLVGVVEAGFPIILADPDGNRLLPSIVHCGDEITVGETAGRMAVIDPENTYVSVKRLIGKDETAEKISAEILRELKRTAEYALEQPVDRAVITVPAYFNDAQRSATKRAGEIAGFQVERILNEPTAAALAYGLDKMDEAARVAVFDLGGGTFDLSILEMRDGVFQVLATNGDTQLGGDDIDQALSDFVVDALNLTLDLTKEQQAKVRLAARGAKEELSQEETTVVRLPFFGEDGKSYELEVTRSQLEKVAQPIVERTRSICLRALADSKIEPDDLNRVILVGGSTRIPLVQQFVEALFDQKPDNSQHPDETVALGAAIQAGILCGRVKQVLLLDVTPLSLGIETFGGLMNVIIPRNTTIPSKAGEMFTNAVANQSSMDIRILQGEREMARDNWELGRIEVPFPAGPKGSARVGVQFSIDADGILTVLSRDTASGSDHILEITNSAVDVEDERVEAMVSESVEHAFDDMNERVWTEAKLKSEELLPAVDQALTAAGDALSNSEKATIASAVEEVEAALKTDPKDLPRLKAANQSLDLATEALAAIIVEQAMEKAFNPE